MRRTENESASGGKKETSRKDQKKKEEGVNVRGRERRREKV